MKKVMFSVVSVLSLSLAIYSCKKINGTETKTALENQQSPTEEKFEKIKSSTADLHNDFLDDVYNNSMFDVHKPLTESTLKKLQDYSREYFSQKGYNQNAINSEVNYFNNYNVNSLKGYSEKSLSVDTLISENISILLDNVKNLFNQNLEETVFIIKINELFDKEMKSELSEVEKSDVARVCGVAIASYKYWTINLEKWTGISNSSKKLKSNEPPRNYRREKVYSLVAADMTGAGCGSLLPGAGTAAGAALASALCAWSW